MRTLFRLTAVALATAACAVLAVPSRPAPVSDMPRAAAAPAADAPATEGRFAAFPVEVRVPVEVAMDSATSSRLSPRERVDQVRDWLLLTAVGSAGLTADEFNRATFDLPPTRHGYQREVAQFEYGVTRACHLGGGLVLALVPADAPAADRADHLAHVADEYRKTLGGIPETLAVFDYALPSGSEPAFLTRRDPVVGASLFTEAAGYHEATVRTPAELTAFLAAAPDLTSAKLAPSGDALDLGGRRLLGRAYRGLRTEDVAAIWQAQKKLTDTNTEFEKRYEQAQAKLNAEANAKFQTAAQRLQAGGRGFGSSTAVALLKSQYEAELKAAVKKLGAKMAAEVGGGLKDGTGFSLDPAYDYAGLAKWFASETATLIEKPATEGEAVAGRLTAVLKRHRGRVVTGLERRDEGPLLALKAELSKSEDFASQLYVQRLRETARDRFQYQAARYDGDLQGTEIGMVLFYTDLVAKLWVGVDYGSPKEQVPEFRSCPDGGNSPIYRQEEADNPGGRLWFGKEDRGFVLTDAPTLLFARLATRLFGASSNERDKQAEVPPIQSRVRTLGWWNDHYEEVARHEPEYERLNQYMKWSLVTSWLTNANRMDALNCLSGVTVTRTHRLPEWVKRHPELRYQDWDRVGFHPAGHLNTTTETMKVLVSHEFNDYGETSLGRMSGGVSGGRPLDFAKMPVLRESAARETGLLGRGVDSAKLRPNSLTTLRGAEHSFPAPASPLAARALAAPKAGLPQQAAHAQLAPVREFARVTTTEANGGLRVRTAAGELPLADFAVTRTPNGFRVGATSRGLDAALSVGREVSAARSPLARTLAEHPQVEAVLAGADGSATVKIAGSEQWYKFTPERAATATVPEGAVARVAADTRGAKSLQVAVVEPGAVLGGAKPGESIRFDLGAAATPGGPVGLPPVRGPPTLVPGHERLTGSPVTLHHGPDRIPGVIDGRYVHVLVEDLPAAVRNDPTRLRAFGETGRPVGGVLEVPAAVPRHPAVDLLAAGNREAAAQKFAASPAGFEPARASRVARQFADADRLLAGGKPTEALEALRVAERVAGRELPEAQWRLGLAGFAAGRAKEGAAMLSAELAAAPGKPSVMGKFLDEVNRQLAGGRLTAPERATAVSQARVAQARDLVAANKTTATAKVEAVGDKLELHAALPAAEVRPSTAEAGALRDGRETVYIDDALKLGVSDGGAGPSRAALHEAVSSGKAALHEFHNADAVIATRPGLLQVAELTGAGARGGRTFRAHGEVLPSRPFHLTHSATGAATGGGDSGGGDDEPDGDESDEEQFQQIIRKLIRTRSGDALGAVAGGAATSAPEPAGRVFVLVAR